MISVSAYAHIHEIGRMKQTEFSNPRADAANANKARMEAFLAAQKANEPLRRAKEAERLANAAAKLARQQAQEAAKKAEAEALAAEEAARLQALADAAAAEQAIKDAQQNLLKDRIARVFSDEAVRKAARDRRQASRKTAT